MTIKYTYKRSFDYLPIDDIYSGYDIDKDNYREFIEDKYKDIYNLYQWDELNYKPIHPKSNNIIKSGDYNYYS